MEYRRNKEQILLSGTTSGADLPPTPPPRTHKKGGQSVEEDIEEQSEETPETDIDHANSKRNF